jgi:hypothetical protein
MRVLVCGGRYYDDADRVFKVLSFLNERKPVSLVIHGGATGADSLAAIWASSNNISAQSFPADWERYGKSAGPRRNRQMLKEGKPDIVIAFPGGGGTDNMRQQAEKARVTVIDIPRKEDS